MTLLDRSTRLLLPHLAEDLDQVWFGVLLTMNLAIGQLAPPMAVNLMVISRIAGTRVEPTVRWVIWMFAAMLLALLAVAATADLASSLPRRLAY